MKCLIHQNVPKPLDGLKKKVRLVRSGGGVLSLQPLVLWEATLQPITLCKATLQPVNTVESYIVACCSMDRYIVYSLLLCGKLPYSVSIPPWRKVDTPSLSHFSLVSWSPVRFFGFDFFFPLCKLLLRHGRVFSQLLCFISRNSSKQPCGQHLYRCKQVQSLPAAFTFFVPNMGGWFLAREAPAAGRRQKGQEREMQNVPMSS